MTVVVVGVAVGGGVGAVAVAAVAVEAVVAVVGGAADADAELSHTVAWSEVAVPLCFFDRGRCSSLTDEGQNAASILDPTERMG